MDANADLDIQALEHVCNCLAATDCAGWPVERRDKTIACSIDLAAAMTLKLLAHHEVVLTEKLFPCTITDLRHSLC